MSKQSGGIPGWEDFRLTQKNALPLSTLVSKFVLGKNGRDRTIVPQIERDSPE